jgi:hypothetical protein
VRFSGLIRSCPGSKETDRTTRPRRSGIRFSITLGCCSRCFIRYGDFQVRTWFETCFLALFIRQDIVDAYVLAQMIPPSTVICACSGLFGNGDLMIFSTVPDRMALGFSLISSHKQGCRYIESDRHSGSAPEFPVLPVRTSAARLFGSPGLFHAAASYSRC